MQTCDLVYTCTKTKAAFMDMKVALIYEELYIKLPFISIFTATTSESRSVLG